MSSFDVAGVEIPLKEKLSIAWEMFYRILFRIVLAITVAMKADGRMEGSWAIAFLPVFVWYAYELIIPIIKYRRLSPVLQEEQRSALLSMTIARSVGLILAGALGFASLGMWIVRLNSPVPSQSYSTAVILVPVFLVLGLIFMCCCCCLPCCVILGGMAPDDSESGLDRIINVTRRLEYPGFSAQPVSDLPSSSQESMSKQ
jgi:hypothetical protein